MSRINLRFVVPTSLKVQVERFARKSPILNLVRSPREMIAERARGFSRENLESTMLAAFSQLTGNASGSIFEIRDKAKIDFLANPSNDQVFTDYFDFLVGGIEKKLKTPLMYWVFWAAENPETVISETFTGLPAEAKAVINEAQAHELEDAALIARDGLGAGASGFDRSVFPH